MKKLFLFMGKLAISGILALIILSAFTLVYFNSPISQPQPGKYTNSKLTPNTVWVGMIEGVGYGVTNNLGYNDADPYDPNAPVIAIMGSSHTEALQVPQDETYTAKLQESLSENGIDINCLNLGISGHFLNINVSNFEYLAAEFENAECVVIETVSLSYTPEELEKMLNGEYHTDRQERGLIYSTAQRIPYFRLLFKQYQEIKLKNAPPEPESTEPFDYTAYEEKLELVMQKLSGIAAEKEFPLVILYHNFPVVTNGSAAREDDARMLEIFRNCCERNGIVFVDVTDRFVEHFNETYQLPYGFSNTTMGAGHLNTVGHSIIAQELSKCISTLMEEN